MSVNPINNNSYQTNLAALTNDTNINDDNYIPHRTLEQADQAVRRSSLIALNNVMPHNQMTNGRIAFPGEDEGRWNLPESLPEDAEVFTDYRTKPINNIELVRRSNGVRAVNGTIYVNFSTDTGRPLTSDQKQKILRQLAKINQSRSGYALNLQFKEETNPNRGDDTYGINIRVTDNINRACGDNLSACYLPSETGRNRDRMMYVKLDSSDQAVVHEFGHYLGFYHNSRSGSLMYSQESSFGGADLLSLVLRSLKICMKHMED
jgi:Matrixin